MFSSFASLLAGCAVFDTGGDRPASASRTKGGYYLDDGPGDNPPGNLADIPDAVPKVEPLSSGASRPYTAMGRNYVPMTDARGFRQEGLASWYGRRYHGKPTSSGEPYDMYAMSCAHPTLPIPSYVRVTNTNNGRSVVLRVNDRGPFHPERIIDLSYTAAWKLDILRGVTPVRVEAIDPLAPSYAPTPATLVATALPPLQPAAEAVPPGTYLQLGAFASLDGAREFAERVSQRMGDALPGIRHLRAGELVKVQAGPFASLALADQAAEALVRELGIQSFKVAR
ncbi:septal ring lytic transglycosylase RlpA family protein [Parasulfuritortus cantonensis]|uniref:septal ring lytic transglycosylase RlpA family protein n=1 Tax=Parasulfuritortus cantonensis TaxID=2528202 RepID=UPI001F0F244A|nr:septal ring lytic transglycosylase RlpA family protein [Parasulfuritortus cantonensis]